MAYPTTIPTFDSTLPGDPTTLPDHSALHNAVSTALSNVMTTLGTAVQGAAATVRQRFETIEANSWVTTARLAASAVTTAKIADSAVLSAKIAASNVLAINIADGNVTAPKIADGNVTEAKISSGSVTNSKLAADSVSTTKIADDAVTDAKAGLPTTTTVVQGSSDLHLARFGNLVFLSYSGSALSVGTYAGIIPAGYRPANTVSLANGQASGSASAFSTGNITVLVGPAFVSGAWSTV